MSGEVPLFEGYRRADGRVGTRNHVAVVPASFHANRVCESVQDRVPEAICVSHQFAPRDSDELALRTLAGFVSHPNVHRAIVVALSRDDASWLALSSRLHRLGASFDFVSIEDAGGLRGAISHVEYRCADALDAARSDARVSVPLSELVLGTECGGSDANSGLTANPALGRCADRLVEAGGTVILAEMTELIGAEEELAARATNDELATRLLDGVHRWETFASSFGEDLTGANPCHGNIVGGISTIEEKSLGCVRKSGHAPVVDFVGFAQSPSCRGLSVMDTSGDDIEQLIAMTAGGANIIAFTTGRGTPAASPIVPTLKIASTSMMARRLGDMIDLDAGGILDGTESIDDAGDRLFDLVIETANGRRTCSEQLGQRDFALPVTVGSR